MQKRLWGVSAAALALTCLTVTGCGTGGGVSSSSTPVNNLTNGVMTTKTTNAENTQNKTDSSTSLNSSAETNSTKTITSNETQSTSKINKEQSVYLFSQSMLKVIYAVQYLKQVGPVFAPNSISDDVKKYAPMVSSVMLQYAPKSERYLDTELIQNIEQSVRGKAMKLVSNLPGYTLKTYETPTGGGKYWWPSQKEWPQWENPIKQ
jgi:hypothetical protein